MKYNSSRNEKTLAAFFTEIRKDDITEISHALPERINVSGDLSGTPFFHFRWKIHNLTDLILYPKNAKDIAYILKNANKHHIPVTPRGGGTCYVGGSIPTNAGVVLDFVSRNFLS